MVSAWPEIDENQLKLPKGEGIPKSNFKIASEIFWNHKEKLDGNLLVVLKSV